MPMPCALRATVPPMRPRPITPSLLPSSSKPVRPAFGHSPAFMPASARGMWRASANSSEIACSAAASVLPSGAFITAMPRAVAASTSMVSTPAPARPITFRRRALASASAVTWRGRTHQHGVDVGERRGEIVGVLDRIGDRRRPSRRSRNRARPSSWMPSQASTFIRTLRSGKERGQPCEPAGRNATSSGGCTPGGTNCVAACRKTGPAGMGIRDDRSLPCTVPPRSNAP